MAKKSKKKMDKKEEYTPGSVASFLGTGSSKNSDVKVESGIGLSSFFKPSLVKETPATNTAKIHIEAKSSPASASKSVQAVKAVSEHEVDSQISFTTKKKMSNVKTKSQQGVSPVKRRRGDDEDVFDSRAKKHAKKEAVQDQDPLVLARTVFVGNLPVTITKQEVKGLFKTYGTIESIRFRSMGVADLSMSKKVAAIKQELNPKRKSFNAYIVFKEHQCAQAALKSNGKAVHKHHLRVDIAGNDKTHDLKRSLFVGNLPFNVEDEDLREHFEEFGTVEGVRIIRDKATGVGKGFGYVLFEDSTSVPYALKAGDQKLGGRTLRIKRAVKKEKQKEQRNYSAPRGPPGSHRKSNKHSRKMASGPRGPRQSRSSHFKGKKKQAKHRKGQK